MLGNLGMIAYDTADYARAMALHQEALGIWRQLGDSDAMAHVLSSLGQSAAALGNYTEATRLQIESLELRESIGHESGIAKCLECLAQIAQANGAPERAAWLLGAAHAIRERTGARSHPVDIAALDYVTESAREALGRRTFTHAWNAGSEAPRETVLTVAIDGALLPPTGPILAPGHEDGNEAVGVML
jgi:tetratricopeptide (TPR) repeat protein